MRVGDGVRERTGSGGVCVVGSEVADSEPGRKVGVITMSEELISVIDVARRQSSRF
jgi:hypothetical protein